MKRKLTRATIDEIRKEMPVLNLDEKRSVLGGYDPVKGYETIGIAGGVSTRKWYWDLVLW